MKSSHQICNANDEEEELDENINKLEEAIKAIHILVEENKNIKQRLTKVEKDFKEYKEKMELTFKYNSFDMNAYKLDEIYKQLSSKKIIKDPSEFNLINQGVQQLFRKNIVYFELVYGAPNLDFELDEFKKLFNQFEYLIILLLTQDNRRFGIFFKNQQKTVNVNPNNININNIQVMNNPQMQNNLIQKNFFKHHNYYKGSKPGNFNPFFNNQGMNMRPMMQVQGNLNSTSVFSSNNYIEYYIFSLDNYRLYFYNNNNNQLIPNFSISLTEGILYGNESPINYEYKLSGKAKFNIKEIELYSIQYGYLQKRRK